MITKEKNMIHGELHQNKWEWDNRVLVILKTLMKDGNFGHQSIQKNYLEKYLEKLDFKLIFLMILKIIKSQNMVLEQLKRLL